MGSVALEGFGSGGGAALNFGVVGNPQPESPKENIIWVNTDVPIGAWYFEATQPENMAEGEVWFLTGTSSSVEFSALKKQNIMVYPLSAKQMVSGSLVDVTAKSYQGGEWIEWFERISPVLLYDHGVEHVVWECGGVNPEKRTDCLYMQSSANGSGYLVTSDPINGARIKGRKLYADINNSGSGIATLWIGLVPSKNSTSPVACIDLKSSNPVGLCETELGDIPDGEYYVKIYMYVTQGNIEYLSVYKVYIDD